MDGAEESEVDYVLNFNKEVGQDFLTSNEQQ